MIVIVEQDDIHRWEFAEADDKDDSIREEFSAKGANTGGAADPTAISYQGHLDQLKDFIDAIANNRKPLVDGEEGRKSVEIILAIYWSSNSGQRISLPLDGDPPLEFLKKD